MFQSARNEECINFTHAVAKIVKSNAWSNIVQAYNRNLSAQYPSRRANQSCECSDDDYTNGKSEFLVPMSLISDDTGYRHYSLMPFYYSLIPRRSRSLDILELVEIPIVEESPLYDSFDLIEDQFSNIGSVFILNNHKFVRENFSEDMKHIRANIILSYFEKNDFSSFIIKLSVFNSLPEGLKTDKNDVYIDYINSQPNLPFELESTKKLLTNSGNKFNIYELKTWAFGRSKLVE